MYIIRIRRGTELEWIEENPILAEGEIGYISDLKVHKIGDGVTRFVDLTDFVAQGPQGEKGDQGIQGPIGPGITIVDIVPNFASLPGTANVNDLYITEDTLDGYIWDGSGWLNVGPIQGPQGETGAQGPQGLKGDKGDKGDTGDAGLWWSGTQVEYDAISPKDPNTLYVVIG